MYLSNEDRHRATAYAQRKFTRGLKRKQSHKNNVAKYHRRKEMFEKIMSGYTHKPAPYNFSILENREEVINYFETIKQMTDLSIATSMDLENIKNIDLPTLCLLSSFMLDTRTEAKYLKVIGPRHSSVAYRMFQESQFEQMIMQRRRADFTNGGFLSITDTEINDKHAEAVIENTTKFFGLNDGKVELKGLWPIIVEVVTNVNNHASEEGAKQIPWLINTHERVESGTKIKSFCVIDLGMGIYESVSEKTDQWVSSKHKKLKWMFDIGQDKTQNDFFKKYIPIGIDSTTLLPERGKGMKNIYQDAQGAIFRRFEIITNKATIDIKNITKIIPDSNMSFQGTIYYWEIALD